MDYLKIANSALMWLGVIPAVLWVMFQSYIFAHKSYTDGKKLGLTNSHFTRAARSTIIASVGPCLVMFSGMVALMVNIGAPMAWLRMNFIGAAPYELMAASFASQAMGVELGSSSMNLDVLLNIAWVMPLGCLGWVIFSGLFADRMEIVNKVVSGGNKALVPILGGAAILGAYSSLTMDKIFPYSAQSIAAVSAGLVMALITIFNSKKNIQWLKEWGLTIGMLVGMVSASLI